MADLIPAIWDGPFDAHIAEGVLLRGEQYMVHEGDLLSGHWTPVKAKPTPPPAPPIAPLPAPTPETTT